MDSVSQPPGRLAASPISRLPDDTLYAVFEVLRSWICFPGESDDVPYDPLPKASKRGNAAVSKPKLPLWTLPIVLSSVCARWRAFAIASPRLWTFIRITGTFPNRLMMITFLERSQDIPLSVLLAKPAATTDKKAGTYNPVYDLLAATSDLADVSSRIGELGVALHQGAAQIVLESLTDFPLPHLRKLWLDAGLEGPEAGRGEPIQLLNVNPMTLRTLHARHISMMWMPFEGLIRLELSSGPAPTLPALLFTLKNSPRLEVLQLRLPHLRESDSVPEGGPPVQLLHLKALLLSVQQGDPGAFEVLPHIAFPSTTEIDIQFQGHHPLCLYEKCDTLRQIAESVQDINIYVDPIEGVTLESDDPLLTIGYNGVFFVDTDKEHELARLHEGLLAVPLPAVTRVALSIPSRTNELISPRQFHPLFSAVPTLTRLSTAIHPEYAEYMTRTLSTRAVVAGDGAESLRCPKLRQWTITWCREGPSVDDFWLIERCCAARAAAGVPIERLETTVAVPELVMGSLRRSVGSVVVLDDY